VYSDESPSFSLRSRPLEKISENAPGPGKYDPKVDYVLESPPRIALVKSNKSFETDLEKNSKDLPGPGSYPKASTLTGPKWGFGSTSRTPEKDQKIPGPGAYNIL
jgi:Sperm-tail PG-rich repeat